MLYSKRIKGSLDVGVSENVHFGCRSSTNCILLLGSSVRINDVFKAHPVRNAISKKNEKFT